MEEDGTPPGDSMDRARNIPRRKDSDFLTELVAECVERYGEEGEEAIEAVCREHPEQAEVIRRRIAYLREMNLLEGGPVLRESTLPKRLGEFRLIRRLGGGGMGEVYLAEQEPLGRRVSLKLIRPENLFFPGPRKRFQREAEAVARLQHPGIVPIYTVGEEKGIPYLVMELVEGCTMAEAVRALRGRSPDSLSGEDLAQAIARCTPDAAEISPEAVEGHIFSGCWMEACFRLIRQAAEALDHAHRRGVVHRDVKPSNLMVTPLGRVMLLDFGLAQAKGLTRLTRSGSQLGSLPYMSPEQVRGDPAGLDARTDIYSLGVTLYELLTLRMPYIATDSEVMRRKILEGRPDPIRRFNPSVPWDAETVCFTSMEADPARRYASAADMARDLGNVLEHRPIEALRPGIGLRTRRWVQRHPTKAVALTLGILLLAGIPLSIALQQYAARIRMDKILEQVREERDGAAAQQLRAEANFLKVLEAVDLMLSRVDLERMVEEPRMDLLRRKLLEDALKLNQDFLEQEGTNPAVRHDAARAWERVGLIRKSLGQYAEAQKAFEEAIQLLTILVADDSAEIDYRAPLADGHDNLGNLMASLNRIREARDSFDAAMRIRMELTTAFPDNPDYWQALATSRFHHGMLFKEISQPDRALEEFHKALSIYRARDIDFHGRPEFKKKLAELHGIMAEQRRLLRQFHRAEESYGWAIKYQKQLFDESPNQPEYKAGLARMYSGLGSTYVGLTVGSEGNAGRMQEAMDAFNEALALQDELINDLPHQPDFRQDKANTLIDLAHSLNRTGRVQEAEETLCAAIGLIENILSDLPKPSYRETLAVGYTTLGILLGDDKRYEEAAEAFHKGIALHEGLSEEFPEILRYRKYLAHNHGYLATVLEYDGRYQEEMEHLVEARDIYEEEERHLIEAVGVWRELAADFPLLPGFLREEADSLECLGFLRAKVGRLQEAEKIFEEALILRNKLAAEYPGRHDFQSDLGFTTGNIAKLMFQQEPVAWLEVRSRIEEAIKYQRKALDAKPRNPVYQKRFRCHLLVLCESLVGLEDHQEVVRTIEEWAKLRPIPWEERLKAACYLALCIPMAEKDRAVTEADRMALIQDYARRAMDMLRDAVQKGYNDLDDLEKNPCFDSLRSRVDFQELLKEVKNGSKEPARSGGGPPRESRSYIRFLPAPAFPPEFRATFADLSGFRS